MMAIYLVLAIGLFSFSVWDDRLFADLGYLDVYLFSFSGLVCIFFSFQSCIRNSISCTTCHFVVLWNLYINFECRSIQTFRFPHPEAYAAWTFFHLGLFWLKSLSLWNKGMWKQSIVVQQPIAIWVLCGNFIYCLEGCCTAAWDILRCTIFLKTLIYFVRCCSSGMLCLVLLLFLEVLCGSQYPYVLLWWRLPITWNSYLL